MSTKYEEMVRKELIPLIVQETQEKYETETTNYPHDKLIKDVLNTPKEFSEFINNFIAETEEEKVEEIINKYEWKGGENIMTAREYWIKEFKEERQAGIIEGRQAGRQEGRREGIWETAKRMLIKKFKISDICEATGLTKEEIAKIKV